MPTIHRQEGFEFRIYTHDHPPAHVHALKAGVYVRVRLGDRKTSPSLWSVHGMGAKDARRAVEIVQDHQAKFLAAWRKMYGP